jgi:hypothetical protein
MRAVQTSGSIDHPAGILTAVTHRDVVAGLLLTECVLFLGVTAVPIFAIAIAFAVGANAPITAIPIIAAAFSLVIGGLVLGYSLGLAVKLAFARSALLARWKTIIGVLAFVGYFGVAFTNSFNTVLAPAVSILNATPVGWLVDFGLIAAPGVAVSGVRAVAGIATIIVGVPVLVGCASLLAERLWYADPVQPASDGSKQSASTRADSSTETPTRSGRSTLPISERVLDSAVPLPILRIAQKNWLRARRAPLKLWYAAYPLLIVGFQIGPLVDTGRVPEWLVLYAAICGAWMTGAAFALNPLGDEGAVLPVSLTSGVSGQRYLVGMVLSGITPGVPLTIVATVGLGALSPLAPLELAALAVLGGVLCVGASVLAAAIGILYPKFEASRITSNRSAVRPSLVAFLVYTVALVGIGLPGVVTQMPAILRGLGSLGTVLLSGFPDVIAEVPGLLTNLATVIETTPEAPLIGVLVSALIATGVTTLAARHVIRTFEGYTIE